MEGDYHWNERGHEIVAGELLKKIKKVEFMKREKSDIIGTLKWKYRTRGKEIVVISGTQKFTCFFSDDGLIYCLDTATGKKIWQLETATEVFISFSSDENFIYYITESGGLKQIDIISGSVKNEMQLESLCYSGLKVVGTHAFITSRSGKFIIFSITENKVLFEVDAGDDISGIPLLDDNTAYFGSHSRFCFAVSQNKLLWKTELQGVLENSPVSSKNNVYFGDVNGLIYSIEKSSGKIKWCESIKEKIITKLIYFNNILFVSTSESISAFDSENGDLLWEIVSLKEPVLKLYKNSKEILYFNKHERRLNSINISDGSINKKFRTWTDVVSIYPYSDTLIYCAGTDGIISCIKY
ncbi:PQQ-binding-like beta-propeller repeat protein, partial [bacterium]|nr:PQQ-binding-like beta-propeller repeat protein [bacterium]